MFRILIINVGDTSTKISIFEDEKCVVSENQHYDEEKLTAANTMKTQVDLRKEAILAWMEEKYIDLDSIDAVVIRCTFITQVTKSGTYFINDAMREFVYRAYDPDAYFSHAGWMTLPLIDEILEGRDIPIYLVDPVSVDEMQDIARLTGTPLIERVSIFHALNQKAIARDAAKDLGKAYDEVNLVVAHMGGGVSVSAHMKGKVVDTVGGTGYEGPFSLNRCGSVLAYGLLDMAFSGKYTRQEIDYVLLKKGGFVGYLGVGDMIEVEKMVKSGDAKAKLAYGAFIYQIGKAIAEMASAMCFDVDAVVLTGGIAHSEMVVEDLKARVGKIAPFMVYPGEKEIEAMVLGALRVLRGEEEAIYYDPEDESITSKFSFR